MPSWTKKLTAGLFTLVGLAAVSILIITPLGTQDQFRLGLLLVAGALVLNRLSSDPRITMVLISLSLFCSLRYFYWRLAETLRYWSVSGWEAVSLDLVFVLLLLAAETYALMILVLGYFQGLRPLKRQPAALPSDPESWPVVDVLIPTYNEPLEIVESTVAAAKSMDWPRHKLRVHLLDDGRRAEFRDYAERVGVNYHTRPDNDHAKAGNINQVLKKTNGELVVIFDCDHIPTRSFLQMTTGWFLRDERLAMLQTPHHFYSPDPFERNLQTFRDVPNEGNLFYSVVQDGNDLWDATFFCGSAAVMRRKALEEVGGIAVETVTEDAHTSLRLQRRGWGAAYLNLPLIGGLATATLSDHIAQRIRWARGMVQILRLENPLFASGLTLPQRLCYFNCMTHFLYALPRLIFLTSPLVFLLGGYSNFYGYVIAIGAYAFPHLILATMTNSRIQGEARHSFWNEIYETVLSPYILLPTLAALINPRWGKFNVTPKARAIESTHLAWNVAAPFLVLLALNVAGMGMGLWRLSEQPDQMGTVLINVFWAGLNSMILAAAIAAATERKQVRKTHRLDLTIPAVFRLKNGKTFEGDTVDLSLDGASMRISDAVELSAGDVVGIKLTEGSQQFVSRFELISVRGGVLRGRFLDLTLEQREVLTRILFGRADSWIHWRQQSRRDNPVVSFFTILGAAAAGIWAILADPFREKAGPVEAAPSATAQVAGAVRRVALPLLVLAVLAALSVKAFGQTLPAPGESDGRALEFSETQTLAELGYDDPLELRGLTGRAAIQFGVPLTKLVNEARLRLSYLPATLLDPANNATGEGSSLELILNGSSVAVLPVRFNTAGAALPVELEIPLPAELIVQENTLELALEGTCTRCSNDEAGSLRTQIEPATTLSLDGGILMISNDVGLLPAPFFIPSNQRELTLPVVFDRPPSEAALEAAGVAASWFGAQADQRGALFPVTVGELPEGNALVLATAGSGLAAEWGADTIAEPLIAIHDNPRDPAGKILLVYGPDEAGLMTAAQALATGQLSGGGPIATVGSLSPAWARQPARQPYDAPRWLNSGALVPLVPGEVGAAETDAAHQVFGDGVVEAYFRIPPDLYFGSTSSVPVLVTFRASGFGLRQPRVQVRLNGSHLGAFELTPADEGRVISRTLVVPVELIYPSNTLSVDFLYTGSSVASIAPLGELLPGTELDLRGIPHFVSLPRLDLFASAGFPFTLLADLAGTEFVVSERPSPGEIAVYLEAVAFLSSQTGAPALRLEVTSAAELMRAGTAPDKDLFIIGGMETALLLEQWRGQLPVTVSGEGFGLGQQSSWLPSVIADGWRRGWEPGWQAESAARAELASLADAQRIDTLLQSFALGDAAGTSAIALTARRPLEPGVFLEMVRSAASDGVESSTVVARSGDLIRAFRFQVPTSDRGSLGMLDSIYRWLQRNLILIPFLLLAIVWAAAWVGVPALNRLAQRRLEAGRDPEPPGAQDLEPAVDLPLRS